MGGEKLQPKLTTLPRTFIHVAARQFNSILFAKNPAPAGVSFSSRGTDSASFPYRPLSYLVPFPYHPVSGEDFDGSDNGEEEEEEEEHYWDQFRVEDEAELALAEARRQLLDPPHVRDVSINQRRKLTIGASLYHPIPSESLARVTPLYSFGLELRFVLF